MKKLFSIVLAVMASVFFCNAVFAKNVEPAKSPIMTQLPAGSSTLDCSSYPTCITINNYSSYTITISVPYLQFTRGLNSGYMQEIKSFDYYDKQVVLYDWTGYAFYNQYVPPHFNIDVVNGLGKLTVQTR